jgi:glycosyltransferase involved in cell wall biosynthesis
LAARPTTNLGPLDASDSPHRDAGLPSLIDCRWLSEPAGAGRVAQHLVRGLTELAGPEREVVLWGPPERLVDRPPWCTVAASQRVGREWRGQRELLSIPAHRGAVYLHQTRPLRDWRSATLVHDTIQLRDGSTLYRWAKRRFLRTVVRKSEYVLTVSDHSRRSIIDDLGGAPGKIHRITLPLDRGMAQRVRARRLDLAGTDDQATARGSDVLWVGRLAPHKNVFGLLAAFAESSLDGTVRLRLVGVSVEHRQLLLAEARRLGIQHLDVVTSATDDDLVDAYARAALVVMPSFEEGWGLPAYEALACGIPVVASSAGSLPEVAAFAHSPFQLVDVRAPGSLARALAEAPLDVDRTTMDAWSVAALEGGPTARALAEVVLGVLEALARR